MWPSRMPRRQRKPGSKRKPAKGDPGATASPPGQPVTRLIQHDHAHDPWRVLACCILLNRTGRKQVRAVLDEFFRRWPDAAACAASDPAEVAEVTKTLGMYNRRSASIKRFSAEYLSKDWVDPRELHGIGLYGWEAYRIVCKGDKSVAATDKVLARYLEYVNR